jgi:hypothetical protein
MRRRAANTVFLAAVTALGAWLRLRQLSVPSFWFDEIYHYKLATDAAHQAWWRWVTIFEIENGPLFYAGQLLGRLSHSPEFSARIAPALCGIATIPVVWFAARAIGVAQTLLSVRHRQECLCYTATILIAVAPLDVYYSREARPYALVVLIAAALILAVLRSSFRMFIALLVIAFYSGAMMAPVIASVVIATFRKRKWWMTAVACALLLAICYRPGRYPPQMTVPGPSTSELRRLFDSFSIAAVATGRPHRGAFVFAALALIGAIALFRRDRNSAIVVAAIGVLPVAIGFAATWLLHRPFGVRYVIGGLPGYLLLVAAGVAAIASPLARWRIDIAVAIIAGALLAREGWDAAMEEPFQKLDWRAVARAIATHAHAHAKDNIIAADPWTYEQLRFYLPQELRMLDAGRSRTFAEMFAYQNTTSWIVVADPTSDAAQWACRFPTILASPLQGFRLHYCPNAYYFLTDRSTRPEQRALLTSFGGAKSLSFGPGDDIMLGDGWSLPEREGDRYARWAVGGQAFIALPADRDGDESIAIDVVPVSPGKQTLTVNLNNAPIANLVLEPHRKVYTFRGPFHTGINIVRFDFSLNVAPAEIDPRSPDHRPLAVRFYGMTPNMSHILRMDEGRPYLDETSVWRTRGGRDLPANIDRIKLTRFLGRLGFDPEQAIGALTSKRVTLANLATTIAEDSVCADDPQFLRTLFPALLGREIGAREMEEFSRELQRGATREDMAWRLANSDEVRKQIER